MKTKIHSAQSESKLEPGTNQEIKPTSAERGSTGKIARLPAAIRESVNQSITDGVPFDTICERLTALGHPGINRRHISKWKIFGYQKWLQREEQLEDQRLRYQTACEMAKELGHSTESNQVCANLITTRLFELLLATADDTDLETARKNTLQIFQLSRSLSVYVGQSNSNARLEFDKQRHQDKLAALAELARNKLFVSEDKAIAALDQLLGLKPATPPQPSDDSAPCTPHSALPQGSALETPLDPPTRPKTTYPPS